MNFVVVAGLFGERITVLEKLKRFFQALYAQEGQSKCTSFQWSKSPCAKTMGVALSFKLWSSYRWTSWSSDTAYACKVACLWGAMGVKT